MSLPTAMQPIARMSQEEVDRMFVDTKYICDALCMHVPSVNILMGRNNKPCLRLAGRIAWHRADADEVIAKERARRLQPTTAPQPWK